jgi:hypothetical protein
MTYALPHPATQLRDCQGWHIRLTCRRCDGLVALPLVQIGRTLNEPMTPLWRAARRFRCRVCGNPPANAELLSGVDDARRAAVGGLDAGAAQNPPAGRSGL